MILMLLAAAAVGALATFGIGAAIKRLRRRERLERTITVDKWQPDITHNSPASLSEQVEMTRTAAQKALAYARKGGGET